MISFDTLKAEVAEGRIDTVLVCLVDMQGRLMGKRFHAAHFVETAWAETHCRNYLLATDLEMDTPSGYAAASWEKGYGDYVMRPDLATLRRLPWLEGTATVLCDVLDHHDHAPVPHSPREVLKAQIARAEAMGLAPVMATELEFFLFEQSHDTIRKGGFRDLVPLSGHNADYSILQTTRDEHVMRPVRNHLRAAGVPVENSKGEAETGQAELNIRYSDALTCADNHTVAKHAVKEIADSRGVAASFLPKWHADKVGSAAHIHQSLFREGTNAFHDAGAAHGMSQVMRHYLAGLIAYAPDMMVFLAPYVNSYKRFSPGTFAPTKTAWSVDNRTAGYRPVGEGSAGVRVECRIPGSDVNPYLACAAQPAAGLTGIEEMRELPAPVSGDIYGMEAVADVPRSLREATDRLRGSAMLRAAMGDRVVEHYTRAAEIEQEAFDRAVTDREIARRFERS
ncbi:MAG TPA: glutamine synthetase [Rhodobacteraceae bacterium]|nr:glutamine synthetase [Paracoccaceae bacterium]